MLRLTVLAAVATCCSSFLVAPVVLRSPNGVQRSAGGVHMMTHQQEPADDSYTSGPVDRRTLLKAVPATAVAGEANDSGRLFELLY